MSLAKVRSVFKGLVRVVSNALYWFRTHTWNRYHIVDCRSPLNDYRWGWVDRDWLMFLACFNILKDFVERELPHSCTDWNADGWREAKAEIDTLYAWWRGGRAAERKTVFDECKRVRMGDLGRVWNDEMKAAGQKLMDLEARDDEMLGRLMKIRGYLWT